MKTIVVEQDDREQRPLVFPKFFKLHGETFKVVVEKKRFTPGDYRLKRCKKGCVIERKGGPLELYSCFVGGDRGVRQLERMSSKVALPVLLIDSHPTEVLTYDYRRFFGERVGMPNMENVGQEVLEAVIEETAKREMAVFWVGRNDGRSRLSALGEMAITLLLLGEKIYKGEIKKTDCKFGEAKVMDMPSGPRIVLPGE